MSNQTFETEGIIFRIGQEEVFAEGRFKKTEFILLKKSTYRDKVYEDYISFECQNESQYQLTGATEGNLARILFVIQGKEAKREDLKGRYFNTLKAIKIEVLEATTTQQRADNTQATSEQGEIDAFTSGSEKLNLDYNPDDLPF